LVAVPDERRGVEEGGKNEGMREKWRITEKKLGCKNEMYQTGGEMVRS
jgi:hypothetical protein